MLIRHLLVSSTAVIWTIFFALCPAFFKTMSNMGSNAASVYSAGKWLSSQVMEYSVAVCKDLTSCLVADIAEYRAMQYFWWFMVLSAIWSQSLSTMVINGFNEGIRIGSEAAKVLTQIAGMYFPLFW